MTHEALVVRARGLATRRAPALAGPPAALEDMLRERTEHELTLLRRWGGDAIAVLELDEDRRTLRDLARGIAASMPRPPRASVATVSLPASRIARVAEAVSFAAARELLSDHPLGAAFDHAELFEVERALAHGFVAHAGRPRDLALRTYLHQMVDADNALAALALATRGPGLDPEAMFLPGGERVTLRAFRDALATADTTRERLARVFAGTPVAAALFSARPGAVEDAALAWQLATQTHLRRSEPLGLASVVWLWLARRDEARQLRAAAWTTALGGVS